MPNDIPDWTQATNIQAGNVTIAGGSVSISGTPTVQFAAGQTVGITGTVTVSVSGTPTVSISGTPTVNVGNTPAVTISGTPSVSISGTVTVQFPSAQSVTISGTPTVNVGNTPAVTISGTPTVSISGTVTVQFPSAQSVTISGTPAVTINSGSVTVSGTATILTDPTQVWSQQVLVASFDTTVANGATATLINASIGQTTRLISLTIFSNGNVALGYYWQLEMSSNGNIMARFGGAMTWGQLDLAGLRDSTTNQAVLLRNSSGAQQRLGGFIVYVQA